MVVRVFDIFAAFIRTDFDNFGARVNFNIFIEMCQKVSPLQYYDKNLRAEWF